MVNVIHPKNGVEPLLGLWECHGGRCGKFSDYIPSFFYFCCVVVGAGGCHCCSSNQACSRNWGLDTSVIPAVLDGFSCDCMPSTSHHKHGFEKVNFIYIMFISLVKLNCSKAISTTVVSLDTANNSSVAGLNKRCEIWLKIFKVDISWFVFNKMARKVVDEHNDIATSISHGYVEYFDPPANGLSSYSKKKLE